MHEYTFNFFSCLLDCDIIDCKIALETIPKIQNLLGENGPIARFGTPGTSVESMTWYVPSCSDFK